MDNLRLIIKTLFQARQFDMKQLQSAFPMRLFYKEIDRNKLVHEMRGLDTAYTLDELKGVVGLLVDNWMNRGPEVGLQYASEKSVFNVLLHFASQTLTLQNNSPRCKYDCLFRWHDLTQFIGEDLPVLSYVASRDVKSGKFRNSFLWAEFIPHDNNTLNSRLNNDIAELHAHLAGSSYGFALNWMSLMNDTRECFRIFGDKIKLRLNPEHDILGVGEPLGLLVAKASAIRFYLVALDIHDGSIDELLNEILKCEDELIVIPLLSRLMDKINVYNRIRGFRYDLWGESVYIDYAIRANVSFTCKAHDDKFFMSVLSGERYFLYRMLHDIYSGRENFEKETQLFYMYLLIKAKFRQEFVQLNSYRGFENFSEYQDRKEAFLRMPVYSRLNTLLAVQSYFIGDNTDRSSESHKARRYLELRITPQVTTLGLKRKIRGLEKYKKMSSPVITYSDMIADHKCNYIYHFIKKEEYKTSDKNCRNFKVRRTVRKQAIAIVDAQPTSGTPRAEPYPVVGVDAASSEFHCRPEVFAQAFRYIKGETSHWPKGKSLGLTFHAGEDFYDVVDGLRAIDEVLRFMNFGTGDRLGHGLALGTDVILYYKRRNNTVVMPLQVLLDNIAWLYVRSAPFANDFHAEREWLLSEYERFFYKIFCRWDLVPINTYYASWLLRGDDPQLYKGTQDDYLSESQVFGWNKYAKLNGSEQDMIRSNNEMAVRLLQAYHFSPEIKARGLTKSQWKITGLRVYELIDKVRESLLCEVETRRIHIECNPTSNMKIGSFERYEDHPITRFFNYSINTPNYPEHGICVSINTDDKGVFATSLEREYSLMALALEKQLDKDGAARLNQPMRVYDWIDYVRQMGLDARFARDCE